MIITELKSIAMHIGHRHKKNIVQKRMVRPTSKGRKKREKEGKEEEGK